MSISSDFEGLAGGLPAYPFLIEVRQADLQYVLGQTGLEGLLEASELSRYNALAAAKRRLDWLLGRLAAKMVVQQFLHGHRDLALRLTDIAIGNSGRGAPFCEWPTLPAEARPALDFNISLAHSHGRGLAALGRLAEEGWIGVDLEHIAPRAPDLVRRILTPHEQADLAQVAPEHQTASLVLYWSLKEAVMKALQIGMRVAFKEIQVRRLEGGAPQPDDAGQATLHLTGAAGQRWQQVGGGRLSACYRTHDGFAYALVVLRVADASPA